MTKSNRSAASQDGQSVRTSLSDTLDDVLKAKAAVTVLTTEQKFAVRNAQFAVIRANDAVKMKQDELLQVVQGIAKTLEVTDANFNLDTLEFTKK